MVEVHELSEGYDLKANIYLFLIPRLVLNAVVVQSHELGEGYIREGEKTYLGLVPRLVLDAVVVQCHELGEGHDFHHFGVEVPHQLHAKFTHPANHPNNSNNKKNLLSSV